ncbi:unnamed protein product, partial [Mesorhabditis spiculigera]
MKLVRIATATQHEELRPTTRFWTLQDNPATFEEAVNRAKQLDKMIQRSSMNSSSSGPATSTVKPTANIKLNACPTSRFHLLTHARWNTPSKYSTTADNDHQLQSRIRGRIRCKVGGVKYPGS